MKFGREILGLLLMAAVVVATSTLATDAWAEADHAAAAPSRAGCHAHAGKSLPDSRNSRSPRSAPVGYQCCLTGHDAAAVRASLVVQPSGHGHCAHLALRVEPALTTCCLRGLEVLMVLSADPPGATPLRV